MRKVESVVVEDAQASTQQSNRHGDRRIYEMSAVPLNQLEIDGIFGKYRGKDAKIVWDFINSIAVKDTDTGFMLSQKTNGNSMTNK